MNRRDRFVGAALPALLLVLPLAHGGNHPWTVFLAAPVVSALLVLTLQARRHRGGPPTPGLSWLAAFAALALFTTLPVPPWLGALLSPTATSWNERVLLGDAASHWRALALDPFAVWSELARLSIGFGAFAVTAAYPWPSETERTRAIERILLAIFAGGAALGTFGLWQAIRGGDGRISGPFVNPNHFAAWLEMVAPVAFGYLATLIAQVADGVRDSLATARDLRLRGHRAWLDAIVEQQNRFWAPLAGLAMMAILIVSHLATGSRGGVAALLAGLGVTTVGVLGGAFRPRWLPRAVAVTLVAGCLGTLALLAVLDGEASVDGGDASLAARFAVARQGSAVVQEFPLLGTGLGGWIHAYRPHQAPPVEYGIWDHAHNDYLELLAESGVLGVGCALLFALALVTAAVRGVPRGPANRFAQGSGFGSAEWRTALGNASGLRWGVAGALAAALVHAAIDFALHLPANLTLAAVLCGLVVASLSATRPAAGQRPDRGLAALTALVMMTLLPPAWNQVLLALGATPLSSADCVDAADLALVDGTPEGRTRAIALASAAIDRAPMRRAAHEMLATAYGPSREAEASLRSAIALQPWDPEVRDRLALELAQRGETQAAAAELEESVARFPYLNTHAFLADGSDTAPDARTVLRLLSDGESTGAQLARLDPPLADAVIRGLRRGLESSHPGEFRTVIVDDLVTALETREEWADAAAALWAEAEPSAGGAVALARAAADYLRAGDRASAESALLAALRQNPEHGDLYRALAVDIYAAARDFDTAERVLAAGEQHAIDMLPVYQGVTQVLAQREQARGEHPMLGTTPLARAERVRVGAPPR